MSQSRMFGVPGALIASIVVVVAACSGGGAAASPSPTPTVAAATPTASPPESAPASASPTAAAGGPASIDGPETVEGGAKFEVGWTGPDAQGDYVTIVADGTTEWSGEPYFYTADANPGSLTAPTTAGDYELWYVVGLDASIAARQPITVTPFTGALAGPETVPSNTTFEVGWNGPDGPGDYVTIVAEGAERWTNESYFYTAGNNPGTLTAPLDAGAYELWYVTGQDSKTMATRPITVTASDVTLEAPAAAAKGAQFQVTWTGPNGPGDYITVAPAGSEEGTYLSYAYTATGPTLTLTAPDEAGSYEVRYVTGRQERTLKSSPLEVR